MSGSGISGSVASATGKNGVRQGCMKRVMHIRMVVCYPESVVRNIDLL